MYTLKAFALDGPALEYAVKATYLYKFGPFVEWPVAALPMPTSPVNLCVIGDDPFGKALDQAVAGQHIGEHPISVRRIAQASKESGCQIMYFSERGSQLISEQLARLQNQPVLTVTDGADEEQSRGIVNFFIQDGRVRFDIDERAAARSGLTISSKLLSIASKPTPKS